MNNAPATTKEGVKGGGIETKGNMLTTRVSFFSYQAKSDDGK
jgi:hypothetical protein